VENDVLDEGITGLFGAHGVAGPVRWLQDGDEWIFIVDTHGAAGMREKELTALLQDRLKAKVWIVNDGPAWTGRGSAL
jgi:hypothetical protein